MPPDRVFWRVENSLEERDHSNLASIRQYYDILIERGTVERWGQVWQVKDYKAVSKTLLKSQLPVKLQEQKVGTGLAGQRLQSSI